MSENKFEEILAKVEKIIEENSEKHKYIKRMKNKIKKAEKHLKKLKEK